MIATVSAPPGLVARPAVNGSTCAKCASVQPRPLTRQDQPDEVATLDACISWPTAFAGSKTVSRR